MSNKDGQTKYKAYWTCEMTKEAGCLYYFSIIGRAKGPYLNQREVQAIIDVADDGSLAGVELIYDMPAPPEGEEL